MRFDFKSYARETLKVGPKVHVRDWMFVCGLTSTVPLILGYLRGEPALAIFGALGGYLLALNDQNGNRRARAVVALLSAFALWGGLLLGWAMQTNSIWFKLLFAALLYLTGLISGRGFELERLLLFALIELVVAKYALALPSAFVPAATLYMLTALGTLLLAIALVPAPPRPPSSRLRSLWRELLTREREHHAFALTLTAAVLFATFYIEYFNLSRGYWTVVTTLLVVKPDRLETNRRIAQRLVGTVLGVLTGELIILAHPEPSVKLLAIFACTALVPYVWARNYWLVTFLATNFVILLLGAASPDHLDSSITWLRLEATLRGCAIGLIARGVLALWSPPKSRRSR